MPNTINNNRMNDESDVERRRKFQSALLLALLPSLLLCVLFIGFNRNFPSHMWVWVVCWFAVAVVTAACCFRFTVLLLKRWTPGSLMLAIVFLALNGAILIFSVCTALLLNMKHG